MKKEHIGSDFDDFLREEHLLEISEATAAKRVIAFQIAQGMKGEFRREREKKKSGGVTRHTPGFLGWHSYVAGGIGRVSSRPAAAPAWAAGSPVSSSPSGRGTAGCRTRRASPTGC